ncbi:hypothetical protein ABI59_20730 [Acidobacteria bacterium Mor1]|nr:hypothetical protein ABI59_20730 [Acidobacteria bacterium Mor1]
MEIRRIPRRIWTLLGLLGLLAMAVPAQAHSFTVTEATLDLLPEGYRLELKLDVDALALGVSPETDDAELAGELRALSPAERAVLSDRAAETLSRRVRLRLDGTKQRPDISFPQYGTPEADEAEIPTVFGIIARFEGAFAADSEVLTFGASRSFNAVHLTIRNDQGEDVYREVLVPGGDSAPFSLAEHRAPPPSTWTVATRYLQLGFEHILPKGLDHILFVLGLFLLSRELKPLLWQITAFTLAHTATLALATLGVVELPSRLVETLIAASIVYVALENLFTEELRPHRTALVFAFGLLHGLGFAGVLQELGLPEGELAVALIGFNVGVELGQIAVVALALLLVGWFRKNPSYRKWVVVPVSIVIAGIALYWTVSRALGV